MALIFRTPKLSSLSWEFQFRLSLRSRSRTAVRNGAALMSELRLAYSLPYVVGSSLSVHLTAAVDFLGPLARERNPPGRRVSSPARLFVPSRSRNAISP